MTVTFYNYTKSCVTGRYYLQTWWQAPTGELIDEGKTIHKTKASMDKALKKYINPQPMTKEMLRSIGLNNNQYS